MTTDSMTTESGEHLDVHDDDDDDDDNVPRRKLRISNSEILNELPGIDENDY
jgi:hypothetical protein